jgi:prepilin-type N-terminal cleavage/methylation domain-containing protein
MYLKILSREFFELLSIPFDRRHKMYKINQDNNNQHNKSTEFEMKKLSTLHFPLSTPPRGMSLMEVLASMFVICIGLLGVLAVIPYGAYQTAKARNAENTSWMLANAEFDLTTAELAKPENWKIALTNNTVELRTNAATTSTLGGTVIYHNNTTISPSQWLNCSRYLMVDPFDSAGSPDPNAHIYKVGVHFDNRSLFQNLMTGQDDLVYTTHADKRTDFSGQDGKILSSGQYTWFFMFQPRHTGANPANVQWSDVTPGNVNDVDILGCYNRVPGDEQSIQITNPGDYVPYYSGSAQITLRSPNAENVDLKNTKYVFLSWDVTSPLHADGGWYKIINVTDYDPISQTRLVFLSEKSGSSYPGGINFNVLIIPGVMYHKHISDVEIKQ